MEFSVARQNMIESQIRPNGITCLALVSALASVERENFVDENYRSIAYLGEDLPIGSSENGRFLLEPMVLGRLLQVAEIKPTDLVLDIGPGSGYSSAVIAQMAESVLGVEQDPELCELSSEKLLDMGVTNAVVICGEHAKGSSKEAPFDVIVINGRVREVPESLIQQLAENGRLVAVIGEKNNAKIILIKKQGQKLSRHAAFDAAAPLLNGFEPASAGFKF